MKNSINNMLEDLLNNVETMMEEHLSVEMPQSPVDIALNKKPERKSRGYYNKMSKYGNEFVREWRILRIDQVEKINSYICLVEKDISSTFATHNHKRGERHMEYAKIFYLVSQDKVKFITSESCFEGKTEDYEKFNYTIVIEGEKEITLATEKYGSWYLVRELFVKEVENKNMPW